MDDRKVYLVDDLKQGDYMVWNICSQTASTALIELKDDQNVYESVEKTDTSMELQQLAGSKGAFYQGGANLRFEVTIHNAVVSQNACKTVNGIVSADGQTVGKTMSICIEDYNDSDYNDYYITLAAWHKKG